MKKSDIKVGATYINKGAGRTKRKVLEISDKVSPVWLGYNDVPKELGVRFIQIGGEYDGRPFRLYLSSFAAWAGKEVAE